MPVVTNTHPIFICAAEADRELAEGLWTALSDRGHRPWLQSRDLLPGDDWMRTVPQRLKEARLILMIVAPDWHRREDPYANDQVVQMVLGRQDDGQRIVPIRIGDVRLEGLPYGLAGLQSVEGDPRDWSNTLAALRPVLNTLGVEPSAAEDSKTAMSSQAYTPSQPKRKRTLIALAMLLALGVSLHLMHEAHEPEPRLVVVVADFVHNGSDTNFVLTNAVLDALHMSESKNGWPLGLRPLRDVVTRRNLDTKLAAIHGRLGSSEAGILVHGRSEDVSDGPMRIRATVLPLRGLPIAPLQIDSMEFDIAEPRNIEMVMYASSAVDDIVRFVLALLGYYGGRHIEARALLDQLINAGSTSSDVLHQAHMYRGILRATSGESGSALDAWQDFDVAVTIAETAGRNTSRARINRSITRVRLLVQSADRDAPRSRADLQSVINDLLKAAVPGSPAHPQALAVLAPTYSLAGRHTEAVAAYREALKVNDGQLDLATVELNGARILLRADRYPEARAALARAKAIRRERGHSARQRTVEQLERQIHSAHAAESPGGRTNRGLPSEDLGSPRTGLVGKEVNAPGLRDRGLVDVGTADSGAAAVGTQDAVSGTVRGRPAPDRNAATTPVRNPDRLLREQVCMFDPAVTTPLNRLGNSLVATMCGPKHDQPAPATVEDLCTHGLWADAARHPDAARPAREHIGCVARGHIELRNRGEARRLLRSTIATMAPGHYLGELSRLLVQVSRGPGAMSAMRVAVDMYGQSLYVAPDEIAFFGQIARVGQRSSIETIIEPCQPARNRDGCTRLLQYFDRRRPAGPSPVKPDMGQEDPAEPARQSSEETTSRVKVYAQPVGAVLRLHGKHDFFQAESAPGGFIVDPSDLPAGPVAFSLSAPGRQTLRGTIDIADHETLGSPLRLYVPHTDAYTALSVGIEALTKGENARAAGAFQLAVSHDDRYCLAYVFLGYAQGILGRNLPARGTLSRCSSSLENDTIAVALALFFEPLITLRAALDDRSNRTSTLRLVELINGLEAGYRQIRIATEVLPHLRRSLPHSTADLRNYWRARGLAQLWINRSDSGDHPKLVEESCRQALKAWRRLPATQVRYVGKRQLTLSTAYADEREQRLERLQAACP